MSPIYLRVSEHLKAAIEQKARDEGVSVNEYAAGVLKDATGFEDRDDPAPEFSVDATLKILEKVAAAPGSETITYAGLAKRYGLRWSGRVRMAMRRHLEAVWEKCRRDKLAPLTSLVVTAAGGAPSSGFLRLERQHGEVISDDATYVAERQAECRRWASRRRDAGQAAFDPWPELRGRWQGPDVENFQDYMRGPPDETAPTA